MVPAEWHKLILCSTCYNLPRLNRPGGCQHCSVGLEHCVVDEYLNASLVILSLAGKVSAEVYTTHFKHAT